MGQGLTREKKERKYNLRKNYNIVGAILITVNIILAAILASLYGFEIGDDDKLIRPIVMVLLGFAYLFTVAYNWNFTYRFLRKGGFFWWRYTLGLIAPHFYLIYTIFV